MLFLYMVFVFCYGLRTYPERKYFSCYQAHILCVFIMPINVKMPTIVGILTLISMIQLCFIELSLQHAFTVHCNLVITCWKMADLLALLCVMLSCVLSLSIWCLGSKVVLDCIDSSSLPSSLLIYLTTKET